MSKAIAVTGANGWLGRQLVRAARTRGLEVRGLVRGDRAARAVADQGGVSRVLHGLDDPALAEAMEGCVAVAHLAGISAERGAATYESVNVQGTRQVIAAARAAGVPRVVYVSGLGVARYGQRHRVTNGYFLSKMTAEIELFRSGLEACVLRPSYIVGPDDELVPALLGELATGRVEIIGQGRARMQPVAAADACEVILRGCSVPLRDHTVLDLVGAEGVSYRRFVEIVAAESGRDPASIGWHSVPEDAADQLAAAGGYRGLLPDELDVLLCDEVADARPLAEWLERDPLSLALIVRRALDGSPPRPGGGYRRTRQGATDEDGEEDGQE